MCQRYIDWLPLTCPHLGTWPPTQACTLPGNRTSDLRVLKPALSPLGHTSQGCELFFILVSVSFVSDWIFFMLLSSSLSSLSILLTSVFNSVSDRLLIFISFSFFWSFDMLFHLGHVSLSPHFGSHPVFDSMY